MIEVSARTVSLDAVLTWLSESAAVLSSYNSHEAEIYARIGPELVDAFEDGDLGVSAPCAPAACPFLANHPALVPGMSCVCGWRATSDAPTFGTTQAIMAAAIYMRNGGQSGTTVRIDDETEATLTLAFSPRRERDKTSGDAVSGRPPAGKAFLSTTPAGEPGEAGTTSTRKASVAFKVGDVVAYVDRTPHFRIDSLATLAGKPAAEMTMIVNERGDACSHRQLGGPALLTSAVVLPAGQFTRKDGGT
jgi:hypothetical protein